MDVKLILQYVQGETNPSEYGNWKLVSFNKRHIGFEDPYQYILPPDEYGDPVPANIGIRRKLECGTAFILSYYEHGLCHWGLQGETMQCRFDTARIAGILFWTGDPKELPKTYKERQEWARDFLQEYTYWCNGECFYFEFDDLEGNFIDGCDGFYGSEALPDSIKEYMEDDYNIVAIEGSASHVLDLQEITAES